MDFDATKPWIVTGVTFLPFIAAFILLCVGALCNLYKERKRRLRQQAIDNDIAARNRRYLEQERERGIQQDYIVVNIVPFPVNPPLPPPPQASTVFMCTSATSTNATSDDCAICLEEFTEGQECRLLDDCKHSFHKLCIDEWLATRKAYCPLCIAPRPSAITLTAIATPSKLPLNAASSLSIRRRPPSSNPSIAASPLPQLNLLEMMWFDIVSFEELLGHYSEIYKDNQIRLFHLQKVEVLLQIGRGTSDVKVGELFGGGIEHGGHCCSGGERRYDVAVEGRCVFDESSQEGGGFFPDLLSISQDLSSNLVGGAHSFELTGPSKRKRVEWVESKREGEG
ncbi:hypothetical protein ACFX11_019668 [Malus domestica]